MQFEQRQIVSIISHILSGISLLCSLKATARIILHFSISTFFLAVALILPDQFSYPTTTRLCIIQGTLLQFFASSAILWYLILTFHLFVWSFTKDISILEPFQYLFWSFSLIISLIFTVIPVFFNKIGLGERNHCWIITDDILWEIFCFYVPIAIVITLSMTMWTKVTFTFIQFVQKSKFNFVKSSFHIGRHVAFLFVFFIIFSTFAIEAIVTYTTKEQNLIVTILDTIALSSPGIILE
eukprot:gene10703-3325_t